MPRTSCVVPPIISPISNTIALTLAYAGYTTCDFIRVTIQLPPTTSDNIPNVEYSTQFLGLLCSFVPSDNIWKLSRAFAILALLSGFFSTIYGFGAFLLEKRSNPFFYFLTALLQLGSFGVYFTKEVSGYMIVHVAVGKGTWVATSSLVCLMVVISLSITQRIREDAIHKARLGSFPSVEDLREEKKDSNKSVDGCKMPVCLDEDNHLWNILASMEEVISAFSESEEDTDKGSQTQSEDISSTGSRGISVLSWISSELLSRRTKKKKKKKKKPNNAEDLSLNTEVQHTTEQVSNHSNGTHHQIILEIDSKESSDDQTMSTVSSNPASTPQTAAASIPQSFHDDGDISTVQHRNGEGIPDSISFSDSSTRSQPFEVNFPQVDRVPMPIHLVTSPFVKNETTSLSKQKGISRLCNKIQLETFTYERKGKFWSKTGSEGSDSPFDERSSSSLWPSDESSF